MSKTQEETARNRRDFLKLAGAAPVAAAAAATGTQAAAAPATPAKSGCVQDTDHVRTYYQLARF